MATTDTQQAPERQYPPYVTEESDRRRWDLCVNTAVKALDEPEESPVVWQAARSLYNSDIPTE